jgi:hypothetical protein
MDNSAETITRTVKALRERADLSIAKLAKASGFAGASSFQRYEDAALYGGGYLKRDLVSDLARALVGKGTPPITLQEVWALAGPEFQPAAFTTFDPDAPDDIPDDQMTHGTETGLRGVPEGGSPQVDVTGGMGGGGLTIVSDGVPGRHGMTFAAENISDYWVIPRAVLAAMGGVKSGDVTFILVQGDSMTPTLIEGEVVAIDTRHRWPSPDGVYALNDAFGGIIVKRLEVRDPVDDGAALVAIISDNARHKEKLVSVEEIRIVGRVVRKFGLVG